MASYLKAEIERVGEISSGILKDEHPNENLNSSAYWVIHSPRGRAARTATAVL